MDNEIWRDEVHVQGRNLVVLTESLGKDDEGIDCFSTEVCELKGLEETLVYLVAHTKREMAIVEHTRVLADVKVNPNQYTPQAYEDSFGGLD